MKIGVLTSHPIQYQAPWFRALSAVTDVEVFFCHSLSPDEQGKAGFGKAFEWDIDLLEGYNHKFLNNVSRTPNVFSYGGCDCPGIFEEIRNGCFDAFIVNGWYLKAYRQAFSACKKYKVPFVVRGDSQLPRLSPWWKRVAKRAVLGPILRDVDGFLSVGQRFSEYLDWYGVPDERIFPVPHFVDNEWFAVRAEAARQGGRVHTLKSELGLDDETLSLLFVGKFIEKKRPLDVVRSLAILRDRGVRATGLFVGDGPLREDIKAEAERLNVAVRLLGFKNQTELPGVYALADLLVLPSDEGETWGLVVNEGMACGVPAVVSDRVGCGPDLIESGLTGEIFPMGDVGALAEAINVFVSTSEKNAVAEALNRKLSQYSVATAVQGTLAACRAVAEQGRQ